MRPDGLINRESQVRRNRQLMKNFLDFISAALPWLCIGLLLAIFFAKNAAKEKDNNKKANYGTEGLALGMCFGVAISSAFGNNTGIGLTLGMLLGYAIGLLIEKKENDQTKND